MTGGSPWPRRALPAALAAALWCVGAPGEGLAQGKADPARGATRAAACAACHGSGERPPLAGTPSLAAQPEAFLVLQLILLREGLRDVPQMAGMLNGLKDGDLSDIAAYYARLAPPRLGGAKNPARHARGDALARTMGCGSCHRQDYAGQQQMPRLAGQREDYLVAAMKAYRDNKRSGSDTSMNGVLYQVPDADIEALAHYLSAL